MARQTVYVDTLTDADASALCQSAMAAFAKAHGYHSWRGTTYQAIREKASIAIATQQGVLLCRQGNSGKLPPMVSMGR